jgi:molybdopterin molybdotransferase
MTQPNPYARLYTVPEALAIVLRHAQTLPGQRVPLNQALGRRLLEAVQADLDLPPFDKSIVDGYAVRSRDLAADDYRSLKVIEEIHAGQTPQKSLGINQAALIMTGAPIPIGADAVVMIEKTETPEPGFVLLSGPVASGLNRITQGREMKAGDVVIPAGTWLNAARIGVLASVGAAQVFVQPKPKVAVLATGDELVPLDQTPGPGQIRNSNTHLLASLATDHGADVQSFPITPDRPDLLRQSFSQALETADAVLICGGVSAGKKDFVPEALEAVGVTNLFHKVKVKPGKPLWFGTGPQRTNRPPALVFGLPGNPVSGLVSFLLFVRPVLAVMDGCSPSSEPHPEFPLVNDFRHLDDRDTYRPARLVASDELGTAIEPLIFAGSSDLRSVAAADGFAIFPAGERIYQRGEKIGILPIVRPQFPLGHSYYTWPTSPASGRNAVT